MDAVAVEGLGDVVNVGGFGHAEAEVVVVGAGEFRVDAADLVVDGPSQEAEVEGHKVDEEAVFGVGNVAAFAGAFGVACEVNFLVLGVDETDGLVFIEDGGSFGEGSGVEEVVAVDPADVGSGGLGDGLLHGLGAALIDWAADVADAVVLGCILLS